MNILLRICMFFYALFGLVIGGFSILVAGKVISLEYWVTQLELHVGTWEALATAGSFMLLSIIALAVALHSGSSKRMLVQNTSIGKIYINIVAIENMVERSMRQVYGLHDHKIEIRFNDKEVTVKISTEAYPDCQVAEVTKLVQEYVQKDLSASLGKPVNKVEVLVKHVK